VFNRGNHLVGMIVSDCRPEEKRATEEIPRLASKSKGKWMFVLESLWGGGDEQFRGKKGVVPPRGDRELFKSDNEQNRKGRKQDLKEGRK